MSYTRLGIRHLTCSLSLMPDLGWGVYTRGSCGRFCLLVGLFLIPPEWEFLIYLWAPWESSFPFLTQGVFVCYLRSYDNLKSQLFLMGWARIFGPVVGYNAAVVLMSLRGRVIGNCVNNAGLGSGVFIAAVIVDVALSHLGVAAAGRS
jgi:hypothetical protein